MFFLPIFRFRNYNKKLTTIESSKATNSSDIQQHLKSMFYLLRQEETLKMVVS